MSFIGKTIGGLLGAGGGGSNFKAQAAPLMQPVNAGQIAGAYGQAQSGLGQQQAFLNALQAQNGIGNQANVFGQQQNLANQLQGVANGTGPNLALAQLNNTTGQNIANQAALMAGQRGAGANSGLLARQAAMQGGNLQQQAVGQGAALQAQQQLAAMQALQQQQNMMGSLAGQQVGQQASALGNLNQFGQGEQGQLLNAAGNYNQAQVGSTSSQNAANAGIQKEVAANQGKMFSGLLSGAGAALSMADGGMVVEKPDFSPTITDSNSGGGGSGLMKLLPLVAAMNSGGEVNGPKSQAGQFLRQAFARGGSVKGQVPGKAEIRGDSLKNDKVKAMLSPGEVVIPRSVMQSGDPVGGASKFVAAIMSKQKMRSGK